LRREGVPWTIKEAATANLPGARGRGCLIFACDVIVRRVWVYPADWMAMPDDELWALVRAVPTPACTPSIAAPMPDGVPAVETPVLTSSDVIARTRRLLGRIADLRDERAVLHGEHQELFDHCRDSRREMQDAVEAYTRSLRRGGVTPERVIVLVKAALHEGIADWTGDEPAADEVFNDGVECCISAYFAA
jgi:hypothetical protein